MCADCFLGAAELTRKRQCYWVLQDATRWPESQTRSASSFTLGARAGAKQMQDPTPGPDEYRCALQGMSQSHDVMLARGFARCGAWTHPGNPVCTLLIPLQLCTLLPHAWCIGQTIGIEAELCRARVGEVKPRAPGYTFRGVESKAHISKVPGPGAYKVGRADALTHPCNAPQALKFRSKVPAEQDHTPAPDAYKPTDPLKMYKGQYTKATIKLRCGVCSQRRALPLLGLPHMYQQMFSRPCMWVMHWSSLSLWIETSIPTQPCFIICNGLSMLHRPATAVCATFATPGPSEYNSEPPKPRWPGYTLRLKCEPKSSADDNPGPGHYDVNESTLGNWGAGMAAHVPVPPDASLAERIEAFARSATQPSDDDKQFFACNRKRLMALRQREQGGRVAAGGASGAGAGRLLASAGKPPLAGTLGGRGMRAESSEPLFYDPS